MTLGRAGLQLALLLVTLVVCACQSLESGNLSAPRTALQRQMMDEVRIRIASGDAGRAKVGLEQVTAAAPLTGETDEALFRLALFSLPDDNGITANSLDRLQREFPSSSWNHQAEPLRTYLSRVKNLKERQRELAALKALNLSLHKDNKELRQMLERLKTLDLELEQRIRR